MNDVMPLSELTRMISQAIHLNFDEAIWCEAEISQAQNKNGHYYIELVEKTEQNNQVEAKIRATVWRTAAMRIQAKNRIKLDELFEQGLKVKLLVEVIFHEVFGLSLNVIDADSSYTFGQLQLQKQQTIEALAKFGLIDLNAQLEIPEVLQSLAVISSNTAAGWADFQAQLIDNPYGLGFKVDLYPSIMQGAKTPASIMSAIDQIEASGKAYDCVIILRGGGSKIDMSAFDDYELSKKIAECIYPVWTGIGHEIDSCVADLVAHSSFKTPTAIASALIDHNVEILAALQQLEQALNVLSTKNMQIASEEINRSAQELTFKARLLIKHHGMKIDQLETQLQNKGQNQLKLSANILDLFTQKLDLIDPKYNLQRGFTLVSQNEQIIKRKSELNSEDSIEIQFDDGKINTKTVN